MGNSSENPSVRRIAHPFSVKIDHVHQSMPADTSDLFTRNKTYLSTCGFPTLLQVDARVSEVLEGYSGCTCHLKHIYLPAVFLRYCR